MKKHYLSLALVAMAMGLASCGNDSDDLQIQSSDTDAKIESNSPAESQKVLMTFKAGYSNGEGISKTAIEGTKNLVFSAGDQITVSDGSSSEQFISDIQSGNAATCNFTGFANSEAKAFYAVYPSSASIDATSAKAVVPAVQTAVEGSFNKDAHVMVSSTNDDSFVFKTANAFIRFKAPCDLQSVKLTGYLYEPIAGNITITAVNDGYSDFEVSEGDATSITLEGTIEKDKEYYISYIPANFTKGLSLVFTDKEGKKARYKTKAFESNPNKLNKISDDKLAALEFKAPLGHDDYFSLLGLPDDGTVYEIFLKGEDYHESNLWVLSDCECKISLVLPEGITSIGEFAFGECSSLTEVVIPFGVTSIGKFAFLECSNLTEVTISSSVTSIEEGAFRNCSNLTEVTIPSSVTSLGRNVFQGCSSLKSVRVLGTLTNWDISPYLDDFDDCPSDFVLYMNQATYDNFGYKLKDNVNIQILP